MALESIDLVKRGDWLVCVTGPKIIINDVNGTLITQNKEMIGSLLKVIGISPPIMLGLVYHYKNKQPFLASLLWSDVAWSKANKEYVKNYLKHANFPPLRRKKTKRNDKTFLAIKHIIPPTAGSTE